MEQVTTGIETQEIEEKNGAWTKVERRAAKKHKKVENKLDVCIEIHSFKCRLTYWHRQIFRDFYMPRAK